MLSRRTLNGMFAGILAAGLVAAGVTIGFAQGAKQEPKKARQIFSISGKRPMQGHSQIALSNFDTEGRMSLLDEIWDPSFTVPPHFHKKHTEIFYIITGNVEWTVNGEARVLGPGDLVLIPANTVHAVKVVGGKPLHTLMISEPGGYEEETLRESMFTAEQRKDPTIAKALAELGDFTPADMPPPPAK